MKNCLFLLNGILYLIKLCCLAQNINLTNHQNSKNAFYVFKNYKNKIRRDVIKKYNNYNDLLSNMTNKKMKYESINFTGQVISKVIVLY